MMASDFLYHAWKALSLFPGSKSREKQNCSMYFVRQYAKEREKNGKMTHTFEMTENCQMSHWVWKIVSHFGCARCVCMCLTHNNNSLFILRPISSTHLGRHPHTHTPTHIYRFLPTKCKKAYTKECTFGWIFRKFICFFLHSASMCVFGEDLLFFVNGKFKLFFECCKNLHHGIEPKWWYAPCARRLNNLSSFASLSLD